MAKSGAERARRSRERKEVEVARLQSDNAELKRALRIAVKVIKDLESQVEGLERHLLGQRT
jgi:hypothetical protein